MHGSRTDPRVEDEQQQPSLPERDPHEQVAYIYIYAMLIRDTYIYCMYNIWYVIYVIAAGHEQQ